MTVVNTHMLSYTDPVKGRSMVSIRKIEFVHKTPTGCMIEIDGNILDATESIDTICDRIEAIQCLERDLIREYHKCG